MMRKAAGAVERRTRKTLLRQNKFDLLNCYELNKLALGFAPPGEETFAAVAKRFLAYQKARLTPRAYDRERSIVELHLGWCQ